MWGWKWGARHRDEGAPLGGQHSMWEGPTGEGLASPTLTRIPVWQVGRQELGTQMTEKMTHRIQRSVQA